VPLHGQRSNRYAYPPLKRLFNRGLLPISATFSMSSLTKPLTLIENTIIRDRVAASLLEDGKRNFWQEIKRIRGNKAVSSRMVDGLTDVGNIAHLFASRYRDLYTSVPYNIDEMQVIRNGIDSSLAGMSISKHCIFSGSEVEDAISRLKPHKGNGS